MIVNTKNIPESLEIIRETTQEINRSFQTRNKSAIDAFVDSAKVKKNLNVRNAETRIDARSQNFLRIHSMRLARLEEMARIARSLNVEEAPQSDNEGASPVEPSSQFLPSRFGKNDDWALPTYYLRGFKAIEEEINVIKARDLAKPYLYDTQILDIINKREIHAADTSTSMLGTEAKSLKILAEGEELVAVNIEDMKGSGVCKCGARLPDFLSHGFDHLISDHPGARDPTLSKIWIDTGTATRSVSRHPE